MSGAPDATAPLICELLHEAALQHLAWDGSGHRLTLTFVPLRRNVDGTDLPDSTVRWLLDGVAALAAAWDVSSPWMRPSRVEFPSRRAPGWLEEWPHESTDAWPSLDPARVNGDLAEAWRLDWILGDSLATARHAVTIGLPSLVPHADCSLVVAFDHSRLEDADGALELTLWEQQFRAWWTGWEDHWAKQGDDDEPALEDSFIPVGEDAPHVPPDLLPDAPAWEIEETNAPADLARLAREWVEGSLAGDRARVTAVMPSSVGWEDLDTYAPFYARAIQDWWVEDVRAGVSLHGVNHVAPDEEDPAQDVMAHQELMFRRDGERWVIHRISAGWLSSEDVPVGTHEQWRREWPGGPPTWRDEY